MNHLGFIVLLVYTYFLWLMVQISFQYIPINTDVAFLRIKQDSVVHTYYRYAFFIHAYSSAFCLLAAYTQFSSFIRINFPLIHKIGGYNYVLTILLFSGPSGIVLGIHANGGVISQIAFLILAILWISFTFYSIIAILKGDYKGHRNFMIRSFSLTLSAITLRAWKFIIVFLFHPRPMDVYRIVSWLGWVLNIIIAEYIIFLYREKKND